MWQRLGQLCASRAIAKFSCIHCNIQHDLGGVCHMLANLIPTSVRMIVHYKSQPLLCIFALQLGAASCKANNCPRLRGQPQPGHVTRAHLLVNPLE